VASAPRRGLAAAAAAVLLVSAACTKKPKAETPSQTELGVPGESRVGKPGRFDVCLGADWSGGEGTFVADMTHPGMVPVVAKATETSPGCYAGEIAPTMAGEWVVMFEAQWPNGRKAESKVQIGVKP